MKKINTVSTCFVWLVMLWASSLQAQFQCLTGLHVSLPPSGEYLLFPEDLLEEGDLTGYTTSLSQEHFDCSDLGPNLVFLTIFQNGNLVHQCWVTVFIEDKINPVPICTNMNTVELDQNGYHVISFAEIDNGSYDVCGAFTYQISPLVITCSSPNPVQVTITLIDGSGNSSSCIVDLNWLPYPNPVPNLACNSIITLALGVSETREITPAMVLVGGPYGCPSQYEVEVLENNIARANPIVTLADTNNVLTYSVTDLNTGSTCSGEIEVISIAGCGDVFTICDTECHAAPLGDCSSGHTADDNVEWPCDISVNGDCDLQDLTFTPQFLVANGLADVEDALPVVIDSACYLISKYYVDEVYIQNGEVEIIRQWGIIHWTTGDSWEYTQHIHVILDVLSICDILPWNTPVGDCTTGHSDSDDVEWPADIDVETNCIYPEDLALNPDVNQMDIEPTLYTVCAQVATTYSDVINTINDTMLLVNRTWTVIDNISNLTWSYVQKITVHADVNASYVCTMRENGEGIPGVELIAGIETDPSGCHVFENPDGITVTPVKDSPIAAGVNLLDKILLLEHILGHRKLSPYQVYAADLSQNGVLSTLDVYMMDRILDGTFNPPYEHNWKFFDRATQLPSVDISNPLQPYKFIGVKMGDIDNSYSLEGGNPFQEIHLSVSDEILNKKEDYDIPFYLGQNERVVGFTVTLQSKDIQINFLDVVSASLPGFTVADNVDFSDDKVMVSWIAPEDYLEHGIAIPMETPLFTLKLSPKENGILSESLILSSSQDNILKPKDGDDPLAFAFEWENVIVSSVLNPGVANALRFYPNPVQDEIRFTGFAPEVTGTLSVVDASGRIQLVTPFAPSVDMSYLTEGLYFIQLALLNGERFTAPMIKLKP